MVATFQSSWWQIAVPPPWKAEECEECVEITQPEGTGALHISGARKLDGPVLDPEALSQLQENCPEGTEADRGRTAATLKAMSPSMSIGPRAPIGGSGLSPVERFSCLLPTTASVARNIWRADRHRHCCR